jgi:hypothetical protein
LFHLKYGKIRINSGTTGKIIGNIFNVTFYTDHLGCITYNYSLLGKEAYFLIIKDLNYRNKFFYSLEKTIEIIHLAMRYEKLETFC